jgi:acyl-CoA synthetase (AMP-forming)/AMP-acid ligase II
MTKIFDFFYRNYQKNKNNIFLNIDGRKYSYEIIFEKISQYEIFFIKNNIKIVTLIDNRSINFITLYLTCSKLGISFAPLDHKSMDEDLLNQIYYLNSKIVFCNHKVSARLKKLSKIDLQFLNINSKQIFKFRASYSSQKYNFFLLSFTSGSTGDPKPIMLSQLTKINRASSNIKIFNIKKNIYSLISTPLHHTLAIRILNISLMNSCKIYICENYSEMELIKIIKNEKINFTIFVSSQINSIVNEIKNVSNLGSLHSIISSSDKLSVDSKKKLLKYFKNPVYECYGLSEAAVVTNLNIRKSSKHINSVGAPIRGVKIKILNKKKDPTQIGEILCKSQFIFSGYYKKKKITQDSFAQSYFKTGDLGFIKNRYLYFVGRNKNMIKVKGVSVYPEDIEKKIIKSKLIKECTVVGLSNINEEEKLCLVYKKNYSIKNLETKIKNFCISKLASYHIPRYFISVSELFKNKLGKIDRKTTSLWAKKIIDV